MRRRKRDDSSDFIDAKWTTHLSPKIGEPIEDARNGVSSYGIVPSKNAC
jgi:hypothetical protein